MDIRSVLHESNLYSVSVEVHIPIISLEYFLSKEQFLSHYIIFC